MEEGLDWGVAGKPASSENKMKDHDKEKQLSSMTAVEEKGAGGGRNLGD